MESLLGQAAGSGNDIVTAFQGQDLIKAKEASVKLRGELTEIQAKYNQAKFLTAIPFLGAYVGDGQHGLSAAAAGVDALDKLILAIEPYSDLIGFKTEAKNLTKNAKQVYYLADATKGLPVPESSFDHAVCILAIQNMKDGASAIRNTAFALKPNGDFTIVMNHPSFRIPRQSSWGIDESNKIEYRRINRYLSPLEIPINAHPGMSDSPMTWSYHQPLEYYVKAIKSAGMVVTDIEEWTSDKKSVGKGAKGENRARSEFPLFLAIKAVKISI